MIFYLQHFIQELQNAAVASAKCWHGGCNLRDSMKSGPAKTSLLRPIFSAFISLLVVVFTAGTASSAESAQVEPNEWLGLELSPILVGQSIGYPDRGDFKGKSVSILQIGGSGVLRFVRQNRPGYYWTPVEVGLGVFEREMSLLAMAATEIGFRFALSGGGSIELGSALGVGGIMLGYENYCDGTCSIGGQGPILSPVGRVVSSARGHFTGALVARAFVPLQSPDTSHSSTTAYGVGMTFGVEVAVR